MTRNKNDQLKLIISKLINEEQKEHSMILDMLKKRIGATDLYNQVYDVLEAIHKAKDYALRTVYEKSQDIDI